MTVGKIYVFDVTCKVCYENLKSNIFFEAEGLRSMDRAGKYVNEGKFYIIGDTSRCDNSLNRYRYYINEREI